MYKRRCDVSGKDFENAADWVRCMDQREDPFFPSFMSNESRRMTDKEFEKHQEWMRGRHVLWMENGVFGHRLWVLDAGALLIRGEGEEDEIVWSYFIDEIGKFDADRWKLVRCDRNGWGISVPRGLTNRLRKCDRIARAYCDEIRAGDCDYDSLLSKLREYWALICEVEDIMVPDLPDMTLGEAVDDWCEHKAGLSSTEGHPV